MNQELAQPLRSPNPPEVQTFDSHAAMVRSALLEAYPGFSSPLNKKEQNIANKMVIDLKKLGDADAKSDELLKNPQDESPLKRKAINQVEKTWDKYTRDFRLHLDELTELEIPPIVGVVNAHLAREHSNVRIAKAKDGHLYMGEFVENGVIALPRRLLNTQQEAEAQSKVVDDMLSDPAARARYGLR